MKNKTVRNLFLALEVKNIKSTSSSIHNRVTGLDKPLEHLKQTYDTSQTKYTN